MLKYYFLIANVLFIIITVSVFAQNWKTYPYHEEGSVIYFPEDEGWHSEMPVEWWYTTAHVTGDSTGIEYSFMLTYFHYPPFDFDGFRIFNIANETTGEFFQETLPYLVLVRAQDHLNLQVAVVGGSKEEWLTIRDQNNNLIPFQYHLSAHSKHGDIDVFYDTVKRPLMVGGTGFLLQGDYNKTYYYSQTLLTVTGTLTLNGVTESITGTAWIDRQWYEEIAPLSGEMYEWFSCQLSNGMDLNIWNIFTPDHQIPDNERFRICSMYIDEQTARTTANFTLNRLMYAFMPDGERCYAQKWHFAFEDINLTFTTKFEDQEVHLPFRFYEGSTNIEGTVNGEAVTGVGFAELLHSYEHPRIQIRFPNSREIWQGEHSVIWQLLNPDDGRPINYVVEWSLDDRATYLPLVQGLADTMYIWDVPNLKAGTEIWLRVTGYSVDSTLIGNDEIDSSLVYLVTTVQEPEVPNAVIQKFSAYAYPNPGYDGSTIQFYLPTDSKVTLKIYNILGQHIYTMLNQKQYPTGRYLVDWNGQDEFGRVVASGIYIYRLNTENLVLSGRLTLLH